MKETIQIEPDEVSKIAARPSATSRPGNISRSDPAAGLDGPMQRVLDALAELEQLGANEPRRELVAFLAGYSNTTSKGFANAVSRLSSLGFVEYPERGMVRAAPLLFLEDSR